MLMIYPHRQNKLPLFFLLHPSFFFLFPITTKYMYIRYVTQPSSKASNTHIYPISSDDNDDNDNDNDDERLRVHAGRCENSKINLCSDSGVVYFCLKK